MGSCIPEENTCFCIPTIAFVSFNFTDESDVAKRFALQTSHCALQWYEALDGYGKMDGASLSVY